MRKREFLKKRPAGKEMTQQAVWIQAACCISAAVLVMLASFSGCAAQPRQEDLRDISPELTWESSMELSCAREFQAEFYEGGYTLLCISDGSRFLLVPEGATVPGQLDSDVTVLQQPVEQIYLVASAAMSSFVKLDALEQIRFSGTKQSGWYLPEAADAMAAGDIIYAGKYSAPDYEKILAEGCGLCIQNTMILHTPEVKENLERFGIPVLIDRSSYEQDPLGRCEWIRLYGLLTGKSEEADRLFLQQAEMTKQVEAEIAQAAACEEKPQVAYFYISAAGGAVVRKGTDYVPRMIEMAGGSYVFAQQGQGDSSASSSVTLQMEVFCQLARDADYLIYNCDIDDEIKTMEQLLAKAPVLKDFKAVQEGHVYCTGKNFYQEANICGQMVQELHGMLQDRDDMEFLKKLAPS